MTHMRRQFRFPYFDEGVESEISRIPTRRKFFEFRSFGIPFVIRILSFVILPAAHDKRWKPVAFDKNFSRN